MQKQQRNLTRLIHEHCSTVLAFGYSRLAVYDLRSKFKGEWKYFNLIAFELSELAADRALLELAVLFRTLDDAEGLSEAFREHGDPPVGTLEKKDGTEDLHFRDMTNKIIHAGEFEWFVDDQAQPVVRCVARLGDRWVGASIPLFKLVRLCSQFVS